MRYRESSTVRSLRDWYSSISKREFPRDIIFNIASVVESSLPEVFPELKGLQFYDMLWRLKTMGEMETDLFHALDCVRRLSNKIRHSLAMPQNSDSERAMRNFAQFIEWVRERECAISEVRIDEVWCEFDVWVNDEEGMKIYIAFEVDNFRDRTGEVIAYFHYDDEDGEQLAGAYDNHIAVWDEFRPPYAYTTYNEFTLFLPYEWLDDALVESGEYNLKFDVQILDDAGEILANSDWFYFSHQVLVVPQFEFYEP